MPPFLVARRCRQTSARTPGSGTTSVMLCAARKETTGTTVTAKVLTWANGRWRTGCRMGRTTRSARLPTVCHTAVSTPLPGTSAAAAAAAAAASSHAHGRICRQLTPAPLCPVCNQFTRAQSHSTAPGKPLAALKRWSTLSYLPTPHLFGAALSQPGRGLHCWQVPRRRDGQRDLRHRWLCLLL